MIEIENSELDAIVSKVWKNTRPGNGVRTMMRMAIELAITKMAIQEEKHAPVKDYQLSKPMINQEDLGLEKAAKVCDVLASQRAMEGRALEASTARKLAMDIRALKQNNPWRKG